MRLSRRCAFVLPVILSPVGCFGSDGDQPGQPALDAGDAGDGTIDGQVLADGGAFDGAPASDASTPDSSDGATDAGFAATPGPGQCVLTGSLAEARSYALSGTLDDGRVLVAGGGTLSGRTSAELYDPHTGIFSPTGSLSVGRWGTPNPLVRLRDGKFFIAGGNDVTCTNLLASAEVYDPASETWSLTGSMSAARYNPLIVALANGQALVLGGYGQAGWSGACGTADTQALTSAEIYDPEAGDFTPTGSAASPRSAGSSALLQDGRVFVSTGELRGNSPFNTTAEIYDPATGTFTWSGTVPGAAGYGYAFTLPSGKVLVNGAAGSGTVSLFDPSTTVFAAGTPELVSTLAGCSIQLENGDVFFATGSMATEVYEASTGTWAQTGTMSTQRSVCTLAQLPSGDVLVAGGTDANGTSLSTAEVCSTTPIGDAGAADGAAADGASE
jgi:hypothetical protein